MPEQLQKMTKEEMNAYKKMLDFIGVLQGDSISENFKLVLMHTVSQQFFIDRIKRQKESDGNE